MKSEIIERLGQTDILLPALIAEGLAANDRVKARLSVLQAAARHARDPHGARFDLADECRAARLDPVALETLVNGASLADGRSDCGARPRDPGSGDLGRRRHHAPGGQRPRMRRRAIEALERLTALEGGGIAASADTLELAQIAKLTGISDGEATACIALVMDLHKVLNRLSAAHAEEVAGRRACAMG